MYRFVSFLVLTPFFCSCTASIAHPPSTAKAQSAALYEAPLAPQSAHLSANGSLVQTCRVPALIELWRRRESAPAQDLPIGPGDIIDISVPEIEEIQNQRTRVSAQGEIELPLIGTVHANGLSESQLHDELVRKVRVYMKNPRVELFVENYRSRGVAIIGAVQKPGNYDLADENESLQSVIGLAGGLSSSAAQMIFYTPAQAAKLTPHRSSAAPFDGYVADGSEPKTQTSGERVQPIGSRQPKSTTYTEGDSSSAIVPTENSIVLNMNADGDAGCLGLPARPGDVLIVPVAGEVMVEGWVQSRGAFAITPGMTILGAVSAAGGPVFSWWVELIRANPSGGKTITKYTLSRLESGEETDPPVQSGDVLLVEKSVIGAVPYGLYELFSHFGTGMGIPLY
jgi:protein involved in polysaccharide export with SLBB domain